ncbi:DMT family transporter [Anaerobacillus sp. CMMVII]|uniref:DMT family transporter n=1 Tax=Anaerobacillus sp. CMMVII TaxID=2755588 RepID=UPI0021B7638D|nr:DMT family transporter [Anaerobacillus sp. CMMVII]MCT8138048.1 DMT family transporter [Anaerobacillus sp. CMMVII]
MGYLLVLLSAICFSITNIILKKGMAHSRDNGVWIVTFINVVILGMIFGFSLILVEKDIPIHSTGLLLFAISGVFISVFGRGLLYLGIRQIGSAKAVAIKNSAPIFTLVFAFFVIKEKVSFWPMVGIALIFIGLFLLGVEYFREEAKTTNKYGYWIALCSALGFGLGQGISKQATLYLNSPILGVFVATLTAFVVLSILEASKGNFVKLVKTSFLQINKYYLGAGLLTSFALLFFYSSLSYIHVSYAVAVLAVDPVFTVILGKYYLKKEERITGLIYVVVLLIFLGAGLISLFGT